MRAWFDRLVTYSMTATLSDHYVDFFTGWGAQMPPRHQHRRRRTNGHDHGMLTIPAHPDVADGLTVLRNNGFAS
ncbi:HAD family hydrolase [Mycobacterium kiyosense]